MIENLIGSLPNEILAQHVGHFQMSMNNASPFLTHPQHIPHNSSHVRSAPPPAQAIHQPPPFEFLRHVAPNGYLNGMQMKHDEEDESMRKFNLISELSRRMDNVKNANFSNTGNSSSNSVDSNTANVKSTDERGSSVKSIKKEKPSNEEKMKAKAAKKAKKEKTACSGCSGNCAEITSCEFC
jgi:hypothetical protein